MRKRKMMKNENMTKRGQKWKNAKMKNEKYDKK